MYNKGPGKAGRDTSALAHVPGCAVLTQPKIVAHSKRPTMHSTTTAGSSEKSGPISSRTGMATHRSPLPLVATHSAR